MKLSSVDVVMCTWNSNKPYFERCLKSVKREIPVHHVIVVDRFSRDGTVDTIRKYFEPIVVHTHENLGRARMAGIRLVDTEYFVFVDDDVELPLGWFERVTSFLDIKVGAVHEKKTGWEAAATTITPKNTLDRLVSLKGFEWASFSSFAKGDYHIINVTKENAAKHRGDLCNTVLKTNAVKDWNPDPSISAYEDYLLMKHVVAKGYIWRIIDICEVSHHIQTNACDYLMKKKWNIAGARISGFLSLKKLLSQFALDITRATIISLKFKEPAVFTHTLIMGLISVDAYLRWNEFLVPDRN